MAPANPSAIRAWLGTLDTSIRSGPGDYFRPARFFEHLLVQSELDVAASRIFRDYTASQGSCADCRQLLDRCRTTAGAMDREVLRALRATVITPFDCEDVKRLSGRMSRIAHRLAEAGGMLGITRVPDQLIAVPEKFVGIAESTADALSRLAEGRPLDEPARAIREQTRSAWMLLRRVHTGVLNTTTDPIAAMRQRAATQRLGAVLSMFREVNMLIGVTKLKAG